MFPTATVSTSELLPYILPYAPAVPTPIAEFSARLAVIEFCERTRCWRSLSESPVDERGRAIITPPGATIHEFEEALLDGCELTATQFTETEAEELTGKESQGQARYISQINPGEIIVHPVQQGVLRLSCFLKPRHGQAVGEDPENPLADAFNVMPQFMLTQYSEHLASGALARIMGTPKQDYSDAAMAGYHAQRFDAACNSHSSTNMRGQQRAPIRVKARFI